MRSSPILLTCISLSILACACSAAPEPSQPPPPAAQPQPSQRPSSRLPDPPSAPRPHPHTAPPPTQTTTQTPPIQPSKASPSTADRPPPITPIPLEFHVQISGQEHKPEAKGLAATLIYPTGLPIYHDRVAILYEWRPIDGKEKRLNPRLQRPYGPIWRPTLAEQMEPENLARHLNTMPAWLDTYIPKDFAGVVCIDLEQWPLKGDEFHLSKPYMDDLARRAPGKKQSQLMAEFIRVTEARARQLRPNVKGWGWWGMGGLHPAWPVWRPEQFEAWKRDDLADDARALASIQVPMPVFYSLTMFNTDADRMAGWDRVRENWIAMYGKDRLARDGYAYLNVTHFKGPKDGQTLTREEFHECLQQAMSMGMRRFIIWDALHNRQQRDDIQRFLDQVLRPEVESTLARDKAEHEKSNAKD